MAASLKAELDSHRQIGRALGQLSEEAPDPLGLRTVLAQARSDSFDLGIQLGAVVTAKWMMHEVRELINHPDRSFSAFVQDVQAEVDGLLDLSDEAQAA